MSRTSKRRRDQRRKHERSVAARGKPTPDPDRRPYAVDDPVIAGQLQALSPEEAAGLDELCASAFKDAVGLSTAETPIEAEVYASALMATWLGADLHDAEPVALFGRAMVDYLVRRADPDALALLYGLDAIVPHHFALASRDAIDRLLGQDLDPPTWAGRSGTARFEHAWIGTDVYGDQDVLVGRFSYGGEYVHDISMLIDHTILHIAKDIGIALAARDLRTQWEGVEGIGVGDLDPQAYSDRAYDALDGRDAVHDPPASDDFLRLEPLIGSRLAGLPEPRPIERPPVSEEARDALLERFMRAQTAGSPAESAWLIRELIGYAADWFGDPLHWSPITIELCLLEWFPRKWTLSDEDIDLIPDVLRKWARFTLEARGLEGPYASEVVDAIDRNEGPFREAMRDPQAGGAAKAIVEAMVTDGIDPSDGNAVADWIEDFNARPDHERLSRLDLER